MYSEDEYTKSKTSLVKPEDGFPSKYSLPFHTARFSALSTVRLIAFSEIASDVHESEPVSAAELRSLSDALPSHQESSTSPEPHKAESLYEHRSNGSASSPSPRSPSQHATSSNESRTVGSKSSHSSSHVAPKSNASSNRENGISMMSRKHNAQSAPPRSPSSGTPSAKPGPTDVNCPPQVTPQRSAYEEEIASIKQDWELRVGENSYAPPPFTVPWGEEPVVGGNNHSIEVSKSEQSWPTPSSSHKQQSTSNSRRRQPRQQWNDNSHIEKTSAHNSWETSNVRPAHTGIQTFDGGWDDQVLEEDGTISAPALAPKATEIDGLATTPDRPIRSEIALNRSRQRVDLPLPSPSARDWERFTKRTARQKLCNEHQLRLACHEKACRYDHNEIDAGLFLALRHTARTSPCDFGPACRRHECVTAHRCPFMERSGGCRKQNCPFRKKGLHNITDLDIVETIPIPENS